MRSPHEPREALRRLFERQRVVDRKAISTVLKTSSRMTVFRRLSEFDYLSSYTHAGAYYTLMDLPSFDLNGLWLFGDIGFSRHGTLKETLVRLVESADAGRFHRELEALLRVRVHNTLLELVERKRLARESFEGEYLYVSADEQRAAAQVAMRRQSPEAVTAARPPLELGRVVDVLVAVIQSPKRDAEQIAALLRLQGTDVSVAQVEEVFARYELRKKTARSPSRRSRH